MIQKGVELGFSREAATQYANTIGATAGIQGGLALFGKLGGGLSRDHREIGRVTDSSRDLEKWSRENKIQERITRGQRIVDSYASDTRDGQLSRTAKEIRAGQIESVTHMTQTSDNYNLTAIRASGFQKTNQK